MLKECGGAQLRGVETPGVKEEAKLTDDEILTPAEAAEYRRGAARINYCSRPCRPSVCEQRVISYYGKTDARLYSEAEASSAVLSIASPIDIGLQMAAAPKHYNCFH